MVTPDDEAPPPGPAAVTDTGRRGVDAAGRLGGPATRHGGEDGAIFDDRANAGVGDNLIVKLPWGHDGNGRGGLNERFHVLLYNTPGLINDTSHAETSPGVSVVVNAWESYLSKGVSGEWV
ncbi:MAG: hypothetical protein SGPRY_009912 [Prymnesium sp.]